MEHEWDTKESLVGHQRTLNGEVKNKEEETIDIVFKKRVREYAYLVRFWSKRETYSDFILEVCKQDLKIQDVFNEFMQWFIDKSKSNSIEISTVPVKRFRNAIGQRE